MKPREKTLIVIKSAGIVFFILLLFMFFGNACWADAYLQIHGASKHLRYDNQNEFNPGIGLLVKNQRKTYSFGTYHNSDYMQSYYASMGREYPMSKNITLGYEFGLVTGYSRLDPAPYVLPVLGVGPVRLRMIPYPYPTLGLSLELKVR